MIADARITPLLAEFAATLRYADLPTDVVAFAKAIALDTLGTALAATRFGEGCREVIAVATRLGGPGESTIIGTTSRVAAPNAAFANGALAHALNYDAGGKETGHIGVPSFTAAFSAAESRGPVSGKRFIAAIVAAAEVTARVTGAVMEGERRFSEKLLAGQFFGYFGAAAGAGSIFGLTPRQMHSAFGLALMQASGARQITIEGDPPAKAIYGAFPNHGGFIAALLAEAGLNAEIDALAGKAGFYAIAADGVFRRDAIVDGLGAHFRCLRTQFKPWPASGMVVPFIEAGIALATKYDLRPEDIAEVTVVGTSGLLNWCEPLAERRRPPNGAAAANSTMYAAAKALVHRKVGLTDFMSEGLTDEAALRVADRTIYRFDDSVDVEGGLLNVRVKSGELFEHRVDKPLGHVSRPLAFEELEAKFRDCCRGSEALDRSAVESMIDYVKNLESASDVSHLAMLAAGGAP